MGASYNGKPGNLAYPASINILSTTDTTPIAVTTSSAHGMATGDLCTVTGHQVNTNANGANRTVTVTGGTTFTINGSTGTGAGAGAATGTVQPLTYGSAATIPSDGDARNASSVNQAFQPILDRTAKLPPTIGAYKLASIGYAVFQDVGFLLGNWTHFSGSATTGTPIQPVADTQTWTRVGSVATSPSGGNATWTVPNVAQGDIISVSLDATVSLTAGSMQIIIDGTVAAPGVTPTWPGGYQHMIGTARSVPTGNLTPLGLRGVFFPAGQSGTLFLQLVYYPLSTATLTASTQGDAILRVEIWRPTGVPQ